MPPLELFALLSLIMQGIVMIAVVVLVLFIIVYLPVIVATFNKTIQQSVQGIDTKALGLGVGQGFGTSLFTTGQDGEYEKKYLNIPVLNTIGAVAQDIASIVKTVKS